MIWTPRGNWRHAFVHYDGNGSSYTGNSDTKHIDGYAAKTGNSNFDFPIGDGIHERISGIYNPSAGIFKSAYFKKDPQAGTTGISGSSPSAGPFMGGLINSSSREFWDIDGTASSQFKLASLNNVPGYSDWSNNFSSYTASDIAISAWDGSWEYLNINAIPASFTDDGGFITAVATNPDNGNVAFSGNPFSAYSWGLKGGVLPLRLLSFNSRANGCTVQLNWNTSNEVNTSRFLVEKSANGISFIPAVEVGAKGSMIINNYSVELNQPEALNYYRIKMIDLDGKYSYSVVINAKTDCGAAGNFFSVYPNPVSNGMAVIKLITEYKGNATLTMINANGQEVLKKDMTVTAGVNTISLGLQHLPKGNYVISFLSEDGRSISETRKIIIK
jgi:hypothetical protein